MRKKLIIQLILFIFILLVLPLLTTVSAAVLFFDPSTVNTQSEQTFEVKVNVDAGSEQITSVDAYILYDSTLLEIQKVDDGTFFPTVSKDTSQSGKVYLAGMVEDPATSKTGSGTLATITFKAKTYGSTTLTFDCTPGLTTDSNISKNDLNATDIIQCESNGKLAITIGSGGSTQQPTPTQLPRSGIFNNVLKYSIPGVILLLFGATTKLIF